MLSFIGTYRFKKIALAAILFLTPVSGAVVAETLTDKIMDIEDKIGGKISVLARDLSGDWLFSYQEGLRMPLSSTFKPLLCAAILSKVDQGQLDLSQKIHIAAKKLVTYSPVTKKYQNQHMTIGQLCQATMTISDNSAANFLLETIGGPQEITAFVRQMGDHTTRLDRWETELNEATPDDIRDTTTADSILNILEKLIYGQRLSLISASQLRQWMIDDQVADGLVRASVPSGWVIGDKTGAGGNGSRSIVAFIETPKDQGNKHYLIAIYMTGNDKAFPERNAAIAEIGKILISAIQARD